MALFIFIMFLLMIGYLLLIDYYYRAWRKIPAFQAEVDAPRLSVSLIIPMRNEAKNLPALLDAMDALRYPPELLEIIIVNDHSTDDSLELLQQFRPLNHPIRVIHLHDYLAAGETVVAYKKKAIEAGIREARGTWIITTDADCRFAPNWLDTLMNFATQQKAKFVAAPVKIDAGKSILGKFQSLDFLVLQGITGASVSQRFHSMCNGANLAYERQAFFEVNGFAGIDAIPSGDDMLLMHKIRMAHPNDVYYLKSKDAIVETAAADSWRNFFRQRIRWASKADQYQDSGIRRVLLLVYLLNSCFLVLGVAAIFSKLWLLFLLLMLLAKIIIEYPFVNSIAVFFGQRKLMRYFIIFQPLHILYTLIAGWLGRFGSYEWKGRIISRPAPNA